ncbi:TPA: hypothetical protein NIE51_005787 [Pseudomonas aeruginosa]|uniref:hypothetical protein n=1 Tax=Pseudomonas aeruginosa TaxID=287 RepID=UPI000D6E3AC0|nr:hypothetical protein [Pseudomonas aeruginosa]HCF4324285.1 hypothetical protein [Pseudomonas aeruginosa]HDQ4755445.1 hypothetical protein [Pseudomonas aeruginosa]
MKVASITLWLCAPLLSGLLVLAGMISFDYSSIAGAAFMVGITLLIAVLTTCYWDGGDWMPVLAGLLVAAAVIFLAERCYHYDQADKSAAEASEQIGTSTNKPVPPAELT